MGPLLPFRRGMLRAKERQTQEVERWLGGEFEALRQRLQTGAITKEDEERLERMRRMGNIINELPVEPLDATTLRRFAA